MEIKNKEFSHKWLFLGKWQNFKASQETEQFLEYINRCWIFMSLCLYVRSGFCSITLINIPAPQETDLIMQIFQAFLFHSEEVDAAICLKMQLG